VRRKKEKRKGQPLTFTKKMPPRQKKSVCRCSCLVPLGPFRIPPPPPPTQTPTQILRGATAAIAGVNATVTALLASGQLTPGQAQVLTAAQAGLTDLQALSELLTAASAAGDPCTNGFLRSFVCIVQYAQALAIAVNAFAVAIGNTMFAAVIAQILAILSPQQAAQLAAVTPPPVGPDCPCTLALQTAATLQSVFAFVQTLVAVNAAAFLTGEALAQANTVAELFGELAGSVMTQPTQPCTLTLSCAAVSTLINTAVPALLTTLGQLPQPQPPFVPLVTALSATLTALLACLGLCP
jgi:hypothetical protein